MEISGITGSSTTSQAQSVWQTRMQQYQQFQQNLQGLGAALRSGSLTDAQQSFQALLQGLSTPVGAASSSSSTSTGAQQGSLAQDMKALDTALQAGNLTDAQQAFQTLTKDLQSMQQAHHHHHHHKTQAAGADGTATQTSTTVAGTAVNASA